MGFGSWRRAFNLRLSIEQAGEAAGCPDIQNINRIYAVIPSNQSDILQDAQSAILCALGNSIRVCCLSNDVPDRSDDRVRAF